MKNLRNKFKKGKLDILSHIVRLDMYAFTESFYPIMAILIKSYLILEVETDFHMFASYLFLLYSKVSYSFKPHLSSFNPNWME